MEISLGWKVRNIHLWQDKIRNNSNAELYIGGVEKTPGLFDTHKADQTIYV